MWRVALGPGLGASSVLSCHVLGATSGVLFFFLRGSASRVLYLALDAASGIYY